MNRVAGAALALGTLLAAVFFGRFVPAGIVLLRLARPAAAAALVLLAALACGAAALGASRAIFRRAGARDAGASTLDAPEAMLVGLPVLGTLLAALGLTPLPLRLCALAATVVLAVAGLLLLRRAGFGFGFGFGASRRSEAAASGAGRVPVWALLVLAPPVLFALVEATTPVSSPDELIYKLAVPRAYLLADHMVELPLSSHSYFPAALSLGAGAALALSDGIAAKLVFLAVYLLALRAIRRLGERIVPGAGWVAAAALAWSPALMLIAGWGWVEWGMIGILLLSYDAWERLRGSGEASDAALCAVALAGALGTKYLALPWAAVFVAVAAVEGKRSRLPARLALGGAVVLAIFGGLFYARNLAWTGSPVAPFLRPAAPSLGHFRAGGPLSGWTGVISGEAVVDPGMIDDALGVLLPLLALLSPAAVWRDRRFAGLFWLGAIQTAAFLTFAPMFRLMCTALAPLVVLGAAALAGAWQAAARPLRAALVSVGVVVLAGQGLLTAYILVDEYDPFPYLVGTESVAKYRGRMREFAAAYAFLETAAPEDGRVLMLGETRTFDLERRTLAAGNLDGPRMAAFLAAYPDPSAFGAALRQLGVSHVLVHRPWYRVAGAGAPPGVLEREYVLEVAPQTDAMLRGFFETQARRVYQDTAYEIYAVAP